MREFFPQIFVLIILAIVSIMELFFIRFLNRRWWKSSAIRKIAYGIPLGTFFFWIIWVIGAFFYIAPMTVIGVAMCALGLVLILSLILSLPFSGVLNFITDFCDKRKNKRTKPAAEESKKSDDSIVSRRIFLKTTAAVLPVTALIMGGSGIASAYIGPGVHKIIFEYDNLPEELDGFRILHISDIHIGYFTFISDLEDVLSKAKEYSPDIILATGDLSDRVDLYETVLNLLVGFNAPLGVYASLGNHEYFRGIGAIKTAYNKAGVPLLVDSGAIITANGCPIFLAGANDPIHLRDRSNSFFNNTVEKSTQNSPAESFKIMLSHRPGILDAAAEKGVDLVLAGHTHGGQLGFAGRSAFEHIGEKNYLWGKYKINNTLMYTSSGVGHWFPFRLGCPPEAPIIELKRK